MYYQVGRAAIASMLHNRYSQIESCVLIDKQKLSIEISVLQKISIYQLEEKIMFLTILSYFLCTELILFLKAVEENCNDTNFRKHDSELL